MNIIKNKKKIIKLNKKIIKLNKIKNKSKNKSKSKNKNKKKHNNLVSIIIPCYNIDKYIINTINSIINQNYSHWEIIFINDCSTDNTYDTIINHIKSQKIDKKCLVLNNDINMGCYWSINRGIKVSHGNYITLLGGDDTYHKSKLLRQVKILDKYKKIILVKCYHKRNKKIFYHGYSTLMFKKSIINKIGYYDSVRFGADSEFVSRVLKKYGNKTIKTINKILYNALSRKNSLTTSKKTNLKSKVRLNYKKKYKKWHRNKKLYINYPLEKRPFSVNKIMLP